MKNLLLSTAKYVLLSNTENVLLTNKCHYCKYEKSIFVLKHKICSFQIQKNILISDTNVTYFPINGTPYVIRIASQDRRHALFQ